MRRVHYTALLMMIFQAPMFGANEWTAVIEKLEQSAVHLTNKDGGWCTAWVVDEARNFVVAAYHCRGEQMMVDGIPATLVKQDVKRDIMVLSVPNLERPALALASGDPLPGDKVLIFGYGYGLENPMPREAMVGDVNTDVEERGWPGPLVSFDAAIEPGQSGGPIVNLQGEVVAMAKGTTDRRGIGIGAKLIRGRIKGFLPKTP